MDIAGRRKRTSRLSGSGVPAQLLQLTRDLVSVPALVTLRPPIVPRFQRQMSKKRTASSKTTRSAKSAYIPCLVDFLGEKRQFSPPNGHFSGAKRTARIPSDPVKPRNWPFFSNRPTRGSLSRFDAVARGAVIAGHRHAVCGKSGSSRDCRKAPKNTNGGCWVWSGRRTPTDTHLNRRS